MTHRVAIRDKESGQSVGEIDAARVTEETRRAFDYRCRHEGCTAIFHWRKAVDGKGNTEPVPPTFVRNRTSSHKQNCAGDLDRIQWENSDYTTLIDGQIHVRVNFPLGSAPVDRHPLAGYLSEAHRLAAQKDKSIRPFGSLSALARFFEKNFGALDSEEARNVMVHYQGQSAAWGQLFKDSDRYDKLYQRSQNHRHSDRGKETPPIATIVRPIKELDRNPAGKRRFACEDQAATVQFARSADERPIYRMQKIVPVIVCADHQTAHAVDALMREKAQVLIATRPYHPGLLSPPAQHGTLYVTLNVHKPEQFAAVDAKYWHPTYQTADQQNIFGGSDLIKVPRAQHRPR